MKSKYKIILVDDHRFFTETLRTWLEETQRIDVIAEFENGEQFLNMSNYHEADVVIIDITMPIMDGITATGLALEKNPELKIVALTTGNNEANYYKMIHAGAKGFLTKEAGREEVLNAIVTVANGGNYFSQDYLRAFPEYLKNESTKSNLLEFSKDEINILKCLAIGISESEMCEQLQIQPEYYQQLKTGLHSKIGYKNSVDLVMYAIKNKLVKF